MKESMKWKKIECLNLLLIGGLEPRRTLLLSLFDHGIYTRKPLDGLKFQDYIGPQQRKYKDTTELCQC